MKLSDLVSIETLHHAYVVTGDASGYTAVLSILKKRGLNTVGNPDVFLKTDTEFTVDDAREVTSFASLKALEEKKYVIVSWSRATTEAQNALLKAVEEASSTVFFFCTESVGHMLPTLRSRCVSVQGEHTKEKKEISKEAEEFLQSPYEKRLAIVEKMTSYISKTQDRAPVRNFVRELLVAARARNTPASQLRDVLDADRFLRMQGSSAKSVLSHLAVALPVARN